MHTNLAVFGIDPGPLNTAANLTILFLVVTWLALVYYTYSDARRRIEDPMLVGCATAAALFPFVGTVVYMIVRPPAGPGVEHLPVLRDRGARRRAAAPSPSQHRDPGGGLRGPARRLITPTPERTPWTGPSSWSSRTRSPAA